MVASPINLKLRLRSYVSLLCNALLPPNTAILKKSHLPLSHPTSPLDHRIATSSYSYPRHQTGLAAPFFHLVISSNKQKSHRTHTIVHTVSPFSQPHLSFCRMRDREKRPSLYRLFLVFRRTDIQGYRRRKTTRLQGSKAALYQGMPSRAISPRNIISVRNECNNWKNRTEPIIAARRAAAVEARESCFLSQERGLRRRGFQEGVYGLSAL